MSDSPEKKTLLQTLVQPFRSWRTTSPEETMVLGSSQMPESPPTPMRLRVEWLDADPQEFEILEEKTYLGRSNRACQICLPAAAVSQVHAAIEKQPPLSAGLDRLPPRWRCCRWRRWLCLNRSRYILRDRDSTNGIYRGRKRIQTIRLRDRTAVTLGPPENPHSVKMRVVDPVPLRAFAVRSMLASLLAVPLLGMGWVTYQWQQISVYPLPTAERGPLQVLAGDRQTLLRRTPNDAHVELPSLQAFGTKLPAVVVAAEDHRFNTHSGVDSIGILRALVVNVRAGRIRQGGSSITQQLARTILRDYVGTGNTFIRKLREAIAALKLEAHYSKDELLTLYLNNVYLGNGLYGFESAARYYFGRSAADLDLSQQAMLAGILPAPNTWNPAVDFDAALGARDRVLQRLSTLQVLREEDIRRARRSRLTLNPDIERGIDTVAPYFYQAAVSELADLLGDELAAEGHFLIETTVQLPVQQAAEAAISAAVETDGKQYGFHQGALVTLDSRTGEILALVGGTDYRASQFNRAIQASRQPGSTFKVFVYTAAIARGISPNRQFSCAPLDWGQLFDSCRSGNASLSLARGLALSENVVALRLARDIGLNQAIATARDMGISSPLEAYPSVTLGTLEVTPLELTGAYSSLANRGTRTRPHTIRRILDTSDCKNPEDVWSCREIYPGTEQPSAPVSILSPKVADTMTQLLQGVVQSGTGQGARLGRGEAGKTGTTTDNRDLWFVGYVPDSGWVTSVWLGNDNNSPTQGSSTQAATTWATYMRKVLP